MSYLFWLIPIALSMGVVGLAAFLWSIRSGQYEDLDGAAERVLLPDAANAPLRRENLRFEEAQEKHQYQGNASPATVVRDRKQR